MSLFNFLGYDPAEAVANAPTLDFQKPLGEQFNYTPQEYNGGGFTPTQPGVVEDSDIPFFSSPAPRGVPRVSGFLPDIDIYKGNTVPSFADGGGGAGSLRQGAVFPERAGIDLSPIWKFFDGGGLDTTLGLLKAIPGNPIGEAFGSAGRAIHSSPLGGVGGPLDIFREAVTGPFESAKFLIQNPMPAGKGLIPTLLAGEDGGKYLSDRSGQLGATADIVTALSGLGFAGGAIGKAAVKTGLKDVLSGVTLPFRGERAANIVEWFISPLTKDAFKKAGLEQQVEFVGRTLGQFAKGGTSQGELAGRTIGRFGIGALVGGTALSETSKAVLPADSWWVKEIANNKLVAEDSPWSLPYSLAAGLPLDIFGAAGRVRQAAQMGRIGAATRRAMGEANVVNKVFPGIDDAIRNGVVTVPKEELFRKMVYDAAKWRIFEKYNVNVNMANEGKAVANKAPFVSHPNEMHINTQDGWDTLTKKETAEIMNLPSGERNELFRQAAEGQGIPGSADFHPGWEVAELDPINRLANLDAFYSVAKHVDGVWGDKILKVDRKAGRQAKAAITALRDPAFPDDAVGIERFKHDFPGVEGFWKTGMTKEHVADLLERGITRLDDVPDPVKMGRLRVELANLETKVLRAGKKALPEDVADVQRVRGEIKAVRMEVANGHYNQADLLMEEITSHEEYISKLLDNAATDDWPMASVHFDMTMSRLHQARSEALVKAFEAEHVLGGRYMLDRAPKGPMQRVFAPNTVKMPTGRTTAGQLFDKLFGGIPGSRVGQNAYRHVTDNLFAEGFSQQQVGDIYEGLHDILVKNSKTFKTGFRAQFFATVYNIPHWMLDDVIRKNAPAGVDPKKSWGELFYRAYPGALKIGMEQVFGRSLDIPYNKHFVTFHRTIYPIARFTISPRFIAMNILEPEFLNTFLGGNRKVTGADMARLKATLQQIMSSNTLDAAKMEQVEAALYQAAKLAGSKTFDEGFDAILNTLYRSPVMDDVIKKTGVKSEREFRDLIANTREEHDAIIRATISATPAEHALKKSIGELNESLNVGFPSEAVEIDTRLALNSKLDELDKLVIERLTKAAAASEELASRHTLLIAPEAPPVPKGHVRLYRGETPTAAGAARDKSTGLWFSTDARMAKAFGKGNMFYVDVPDAAAKKFRVADSLGGKPEYVVDQATAGAKSVFSALLPGETMTGYAARTGKVLTRSTPADLQPFLDALAVSDRKQVKWARDVLYGNPNRSAVERVLNSYLLFWPLSYQVKVTKALFEFMFSRGFGYKTNMSTAAAVSHAQEWHKDNLENDPEYNRFFKDNRHMVFLFQNLFPTTPGEIGASLSPVFRLPMQVARGYRSTDEAFEKFTDLGPMYDVNMMREIIKEQSKPGRIFGELFPGGDK